VRPMSCAARNVKPGLRLDPSRRRRATHDGEIGTEDSRRAALAPAAARRLGSRGQSPLAFFVALNWLQRFYDFLAV